MRVSVHRTGGPPPANDLAKYVRIIAREIHLSSEGRHLGIDIEPELSPPKRKGVFNGFTNDVQ